MSSAKNFAELYKDIREIRAKEIQSDNLKKKQRMDEMKNPLTEEEIITLAKELAYKDVFEPKVEECDKYDIFTKWYNYNKPSDAETLWYKTFSSIKTLSVWKCTVRVFNKSF